MGLNEPNKIQLFSSTVGSSFDHILNLTNIIGGDRDDITQYVEYHTNVMIWRYLAPIILVVGTIGSVLSLLVLCRRSMRAQTTMFYLSALAVVDIMVLYGGLIRMWLEQAEETYIRLTSRTACKLHNYITYLSLDLSVWILVAVSIDRCLYVSWPMVARKWCSIRNSRIIILITSFLCALINIHFFWTYDLETFEANSRQIYAHGNKRCYADTSVNKIVSFIENVWPWIDFCVYCLFPFVLMAISNAIIIKQLIRTDRNMTSYQNVVVHGREGNIEVLPGKRVFSKNTHSSANSSQKSNLQSNEITRKYGMQVEGVNCTSQCDSFVLPIASKFDDECYNRNNRLAETDQTWSMDADYEGRSTSDVQEMDISLRTLSRDYSFLELEHQTTHEVISVKPFNFQTEESLGIFPIKLQPVHTDLCEEANRKTMDLDCSQKHFVSVNIENHSESRSLLTSRLSVEMCSLHEDTMPDIKLNEDNTKSVFPQVTSISEELFYRDELSSNINESVACFQTDNSEKYIAVGFQTDNSEKDIAVSSKLQPKNHEAKIITTLTERKKTLNNKISPVCTSFCDRSSEIFLIGGPETPTTPDTARSGFWATSNTEMDLLVNKKQIDNKKDKHRFYEIFDKVNRNFQLNKHSINANNFPAEVNRYPGCGQKQNVINSVSKLRDTEDNSKCRFATNQGDFNHAMRAAIQPPITFNKKWQTISINSETLNPASSRRKTRGVGKTLLAITIMFWILNAPIVIFIIGHTYFVTSADGRGHAIINLAWGIVNILQYLNNALHFFLYCLTGPKFRQEFINMCKTWVWILRKLTCKKTQL